MAQNTLAQDKQTPAATKTLLAPPEEQLWKRYSQHHEASLSGAGSFAIHVLVVGVRWLLERGEVGSDALGYRNGPATGQP
jgi:hypothetical protein